MKKRRLKNEQLFNCVPDIYDKGPDVGSSPDDIFLVYGPYYPIHPRPKPTEYWVFSDKFPIVFS